MTEILHAPAWVAPPAPPPMPTTKSYSKAQLLDLQGDLMIWLPDLKPTFREGVDPETGIHAIDDRGATPRGILAGWIWTLWLPWYPAAKRALIYAEVRRLGYTHVAIQVCEQVAGDTGYHGLRPITTADAAGYGALMNVVHAELLAVGLIPICAGVAPVGTPGGARLAPGFDAAQALVAMSDWDNTTWAAGRIKCLSDTFPNAWLFYERPGNKTQAQPDVDPSGADPVVPNATNGGAWIRAMQQRYPRFVGVLYEVNNPDGLEACAAELALAHAWWRDVQEVRFEIDTYWKFWENDDAARDATFNDQLQARCPWLAGFMSGGTAHPPPADEAPPQTGGAVGDMIPVASITFVGGPNIGAWPATATITRLELRAGSLYVEHTKQDGPGSWPDTAPAGGKEPGVDMGPLQYSLGLALNINGRWYASAPIELWRGLKESGGPIQSQDVKDGTGLGQIRANWFYDGRWAPLDSHQPAPGETIGVFVCAGDARNGVCPVQERSNIVAIPLPADGVTAAYTWTA